MVKNPSANAGDVRDARFNPWVGKIPWRRDWLPMPVLLPGPQGCKKLDTTEATQHTHAHRELLVVASGV